MSDRMAWSEIQEMFDAEWVLLDDPEVGEDMEVKTGLVLWHGKDRDELYRRALELKPKRSAIFYIGQLPPGVAVML